MCPVLTRPLHGGLRHGWHHTSSFICRRGAMAYWRRRAVDVDLGLGPLGGGTARDGGVAGEQLGRWRKRNGEGPGRRRQARLFRCSSSTLFPSLNLFFASCPRCSSSSWKRTKNKRKDMRKQMYTWNWRVGQTFRSNCLMGSNLGIEWKFTFFFWWEKKIGSELGSDIWSDMSASIIAIVCRGWSINQVSNERPIFADNIILTHRRTSNIIDGNK